jgi:hypothetical protein
METGEPWYSALCKSRGTRPQDVCILPLLFALFGQPPTQYEERIPHQDQQKTEKIPSTARGNTDSVDSMVGGSEMFDADF